MRISDIKEREFNLLDLIVESYIHESKPISSSYLCKKFNLPYSSATVRNVMESLERQGFVCHVHTSSGRIPTQVGFRHYVEAIKEREREMTDGLELPLGLSGELSVDDTVSDVLEILSNVSGYTSLISIADNNMHKFVCRGMRLMLEQPEFNDLAKFKNILYTLEVRMDELREILDYYSGEDLKILIGDEIGFNEIAECAMIVSGISKNKNRTTVSLALLGPMRMDYVRAGAYLLATRDYLKDIFSEGM
ncbi:MAG: hypothetical protein PHP69_04490 [Candidatus Omnitrophica bacterium]|nr:hypothetical protein [Candidatus Omnitrophota bacterium]MDD5081351.1 hypothetical protein [Candidatus Omnitrophota bacterium]MDD5441432.1 hypothetical protein [Candidatus Omnitrophota bacterium]